MSNNETAESDIWSKYEKEIDGDVIETAIEEAANDEVVCRECAAALGQITAQHVQTHGMTLDEYRQEHSDAPVYPAAESRQPGREPGFEHEEKTKQKIGQSVREARRDDE